jgi:hypothetical protein
MNDIIKEDENLLKEIEKEKKIINNFFDSLDVLDIKEFEKLIAENKEREVKDGRGSIQSYPENSK